MTSVKRTKRKDIGDDNNTNKWKAEQKNMDVCIEKENRSDNMKVARINHKKDGVELRGLLQW